jgi:hypothetical protein
VRVVGVIDEEIEWWEAKSRAMKRPNEVLALACAIGAITALNNILAALRARQSGEGNAKGSDHG